MEVQKKMKNGTEMKSVFRAEGGLVVKEQKVQWFHRRNEGTKVLTGLKVLGIETMNS